MDVGGRMPFNQFIVLISIARSLLFAAATCLAVHSNAALSRSVPIWTSFTQENSDLPDDAVLALALNPHGSLLVGTRGGGFPRPTSAPHVHTSTQAHPNTRPH